MSESKLDLVIFIEVFVEDTYCIIGYDANFISFDYCKGRVLFDQNVKLLAYFVWET